MGTPGTTVVVIASTQAPAWFVVLALLELAFVTCFFATELARFAWRGHLTRIERTLHAVPTDRYVNRFFLPLASVIVSASVGIGINLLTNVDLSSLGQYLGLVLVVVSVVVIGGYLGRHATESFPRPGARARLRRALAEVEEALGSDAVLEPSDLLRMRARLRRIRGVGSRLERRASSMGWRDVVRQERRWFAAAVALAALLPFVALVWSVVLAVEREDPVEASPAGMLASLGVATVIAASLRSVRYRRDLHALGVELRTASERLLLRLPSIDAAPPPASRPPRTVRSVLRDLLSRRRHRGRARG